MRFVHRVAVAVAGTLVGVTLAAAPISAQMSTLTSVQRPSLHIVLLPPHGKFLRGILQRTNSCNQVTFLKSPAHVVPPIYRAVQIRSLRPACAQVVQWVPASVQIPNRVNRVSVQATNGSFIVH
jgi:hypothetical protein